MVVIYKYPKEKYEQVLKVRLSFLLVGDREELKKHPFMNQKILPQTNIVLNQTKSKYTIHLFLSSLSEMYKLLGILPHTAKQGE